MKFVDVYGRGAADLVTYPIDAARAALTVAGVDPWWAGAIPADLYGHHGQVPKGFGLLIRAGVDLPRSVPPVWTRWPVAEAAARVGVAAPYLARAAFAALARWSWEDTPRTTELEGPALGVPVSWIADAGGSLAIVAGHAAALVDDGRGDADCDLPAGWVARAADAAVVAVKIATYVERIPNDRAAIARALVEMAAAVTPAAIEEAEGR